MNWPTVRALVSKDVKLYFRNRFFAFVSILGIVAYAIFYYIMPSDVEEFLDLAVYAPMLPPILQQAQAEGLTIHSFDNQDELITAVEDGEYQAGIVIPPNIVAKLNNGTTATINLYFASDSPVELRDAVSIMIEELAYAQSGQVLNVEVNEQIIGRDMVGMQIPPRDRILPLFAVFIIIVEMMGLASLMSEEIEAGTHEALLITPMTIGGLFMAKGITGISLAFGQASIFLAVTGGFSQQPLVIIVALLLGSGLATAIGFLLAARGKDLMSVMAWSVPVLLLLLIPGLVVMFPGVTSDWIKVIPSYYLVDTVHLAANFDAGWADVWSNLLILLLLTLVFFGLGIVALRRRIR